MVFRVKQDGTPVDDDVKKQLPKDDDRDAMMIGREKMPTVQQIYDHANADEAPKIIMQRPPPTYKAASSNVRTSAVFPTTFKTVRTLYSNYRIDDRAVNTH